MKRGPGLQSVGSAVGVGYVLLCVNVAGPLEQYPVVYIYSFRKFVANSL